MGWTKRDFVAKAFEELGLASYIYDIAPEQLESVLRRLDAMMATWNAKGIHVGYPIASSPDGSNLDDVTGVSDSCNEAIYLNLAIRIAPSFGKQIPQETKQAAKDSYDALMSKLAMPTEIQFPNTLPLGAGNRNWQIGNRPFARDPVESLLADSGDEITFT